MIFLIRVSTSTSTLQTYFHLFFVLRCFLIKNLTSDLSNAPLPRCPAQNRVLKLQNVWLDLCKKKCNYPLYICYSPYLFFLTDAWNEPVKYLPAPPQYLVPQVPHRPFVQNNPTIPGERKQICDVGENIYFPTKAIFWKWQNRLEQNECTPWQELMGNQK